MHVELAESRQWCKFVSPCWTCGEGHPVGGAIHLSFDCKCKTGTAQLCQFKPLMLDKSLAIIGLHAAATYR